IYTLGDIALFEAILNGVAMIFGSGMLEAGAGFGVGAAIGLGLLVSLIVVLAGGMMNQATGRGGVNVGVLLVLVVLMVGVSGPKGRVNIEDMYTGQIAAVDNIPMGVAFSGAVISAVTRRVAEGLETAMSTVRGNYIAMSTHGFVNPLRLLLS